MSFQKKTTYNNSRIQTSTCNITDTLTCAGTATFTAVDISGNLDLSSNLAITGNTYMYGNLFANSTQITPLNLSYLASSTANIQTQLNNIYSQNANAVSGTSTPFTCSYSTTGDNIFYIPSNYAPTANYNIIITNIPTTTSKSYIITVINRQATGTFYCNGVRVSDTGSGYSFSGASGTNSSSTYCVPYYNGGAPLIVTTPNIIIQQFSIVSIPTSAGVYTRYITSSVNNLY